MLSNRYIKNVKDKLYDAFNPEVPINDMDPRYTDCTEVRKVTKILKQMTQQIRLADRPTCQLCCGHRGCGKTTELNRLMNDLKTDEPPYFVVYCDTDKLLDLNHISSFEVLLAVICSVAKTAVTVNIQPLTDAFASFWKQYLGGLSNRVNINNLAEQNSFVRSQVRRQISKTNGEIYLKAVNEIINFARHQLQANGYADLVVVVDNLDRVPRMPIPGTNTNLQEELFITNVSHLTSLNCFMIYTLPPALIHSSHGFTLKILYDTEPHLLPMVPVKTRAGKEYQPGVDKLMDVLGKRITYAEATFKEVFDTKRTAEVLCKSSGGCIRLLMTLMQSALNIVEDSPRIPGGALLDISKITAARYDSRICIAPDKKKHWKALREVRRTKQKVSMEECIELQDSLAILSYYDEEVWWDVNPMVTKK